MEWILISHKKPPAMQKVLTSNGKESWIAIFTNPKKNICVADCPFDSYFPLLTPTHWMPLPRCPFEM